MRKWVMGIMLIGLFSSMVYAASDKASVEQYYTQIAQQGLDALFGKGQAVVRVSVMMTEPRYDVKYTRPSKVEGSAKQADGKMNILPGYSVIKNLSPENSQKMPFDSVTNYVSSAVTQINVYILMNKALPKNIASKAEPALIDLLGLKQGRDAFKIDFKPFYNVEEQSKSDKKDKEKKEKTESGFNLQHVFNAIFSLLGVVFLLMYFFLGKKSSQASSGQSGGGGQTNVSVSPSIELKERASSQSGGGSQQITVSSEPPIKQFFNFVTDRNIHDLIFLIKKENIGTEHIAIMLSFLSGYPASVLFKSLNNSEKAIVASQLSDQKMMNREMLDKFEKKIKVALECFVGGEHSVKNLFAEVKNEEKKSVLDLIRTSQPESFKKLRKFIVTFEDLVVLSDEDTKKVINEVNVELIATALQNVPQALYQHFDDNLTSNSRAMVTEFLELKGNSISKKEIESAQEYILSVAEQLDAQGGIDLKGKLSA